MEPTFSQPSLSPLGLGYICPSGTSLLLWPPFPGQALLCPPKDSLCLETAVNLLWTSLLISLYLLRTIYNFLLPIGGERNTHLLFWHLKQAFKGLPVVPSSIPTPSLCLILMLSPTFPSLLSPLHLCSHPSPSLESFSGPHLSFSGQPGSCLLLVSPDHSRMGCLLILHLEFGSCGFIVQHGACDSVSVLPKGQAAHGGGCILAVPGATECLCGLKEALGTSGVIHMTPTLGSGFMSITQVIFEVVGRRAEICRL